MNDEQLIQLLREKTPEELSVDEIKLLRSRLAESEELRTALFEQLEMEEYLAAALGRVNVSVESVTQHANRQGDGPHPILLAVIIVICLGLIGFISLVIVAGFQGQKEKPVAQADGESEDAESQDSESQDAVSGDGEPAPIDNEPVDGSEPSSADAEEPPADGDAAPAEEPPDPEPPVEETDPQPEEPPEPEGPWVAGLASPPVPFSQTWYVDFDTEKHLPGQETLQKWFAKVPGKNSRFYEEKIHDAAHGTFDGLIKLEAPLQEDAALRFSTSRADQLRLHCFRGEEGVSIYWNTRHGAADRWASYRTTRDAGKPTPAQFHLTDTDEGRDEVSDARYGPTLLLFWHDDELILTRGDIELARAGFPGGPPEEIYFEGKASFRGIEMLRLNEYPEPPDQWPGPYEVVERPADLPWEGELPEGVDLEKRDDGSIHLAMDNTQQFGWAATPLPLDRVRFVEIELDDLSQGAQIWLGPPEVRNGAGEVTEKAGRPNNPTLSFVVNEREKHLVADWKPRDESRRTAAYHAMEDKAVPYVGERTWLRFLVAAGWVRCWMSTDGDEWGILNWGEPWYAGQMTHLSIGCSKETPGAGLTVRQIRYRELPAINGLAAPELLAQAESFHEEPSYSHWLSEVTMSQPSGVDADDWRTACAVRTMATGCPNKTMQSLLDLLLRSSQDGATTEEQLQLLCEATMLASLWQKLPSDEAIDVAARYHKLGRRLVEGGQQRPYTAVRHAMMTELPRARHFFKAFDEDLIRVELLHLAYQKRWDELTQFIEQLKFYGGGQFEQAVPLAPWLELLAARQKPARIGDGVTRMRSDWQNPLVENYNKEAYNVIAEFHATIESDSHEDAAEMIAALDPYAMNGLVPSRNDADLLVSVSTAVRSAMNRNQQLAEIVNDKFAPLGKLRVRQATTVGDEAAVRLATVQFHGTEAAGMAHRWLGDRALSAGEFVTALAEYRRASETVGVLEKREIAPRMRLAAAMLGVEFGEPVSGNVQFGDIQMTSDEFEKLVDEMRNLHADASDALVEFSGESASPAVRPTGMQVHRRGRLDGEAGENSGDIDGRVRQYEVSWLARQIGVTVEGNVAYVNNRFHVAAYDLSNNGNRLWNSPPPPNRGRTKQWMLTAMRPIVAGDQVIVRQLAKDGPLLVCLDRENGQHQWVMQSSRDEHVVSDPVLAQGKLFALTLQRNQRGEDMVRLCSYSRDTGELMSAHDLVGVRDSWEERNVCNITVLPDGMLANMGGFVMNVDFGGYVRWVRRQLVLPASQEPTWVTQRFDRPLVNGEQVIIATPGVRAMECLDVDSGELRWRTVLPYVDRLIGVAAGNVIVHAGDDVMALNGQTGEQVWKTQMLGLLEGELCGGEHGILMTHAIQSPTNKDRRCPELVWLDGKTGAITARTVLAKLSEEDPRLGPLWRHQDRLWLFFGNRSEDPHRNLMELEPQGEADKPEALVTTSADPWLMYTPQSIRRDLEDKFPQWTLMDADDRDGYGYIADIHGEKDIIALPAANEHPILLGRELKVPASGNPQLKLRFGNDPNHHWKLIVRLGEEVLLDREVDWSKESEIWKNVTVDLKPVAGKSGWLTIEGRFVSHGDHSRTYWKQIDVKF